MVEPYYVCREHMLHISKYLEGTGITPEVVRVNGVCDVCDKEGKIFKVMETA